VIVGPTGVGKSRLAINMAKLFNGEIVNADSRQVYRFMNIATAKPDRSEFNEVPHHLFDIVDPDQEFGLAQFQQLAKLEIDNILTKDKIPFLVGGSGQYLWSVLEGWQIPRIAPDLKLRNDLETFAREQGQDELFKKLELIDPVSSRTIDKRNIRRVIRALEVSQTSGSQFSRLKLKNPPDYRYLIIGLTACRESLYGRVDSRVDKMLTDGLETETLNLLQRGYIYDLPSMNTIGYKQYGLLAKGKIRKEEIAQKIKNDTHRYIRHQYAWFRLKDERIVWFDISSKFEDETSILIDSHLRAV
jgi:tRNA dimethylallyltransferase